MANCSNADLLPLSEDYYREIQPAKRYFLYVDIGLTMAVLLLFVEECHFVVKTYKHYQIAVKSIWLISIYPVFATSALMAVLVPRASYICDFVSACYLSACFLQFSSLILLYFGRVDRLLSAVSDTGFSFRARPCCCCLCCPVMPPTFQSLRTVRIMVFQTAVLLPIIQFISAVLWADDKYDRVGIDFTKSYIYLTILKVASTIVAILGLNIMHEATQPHLQTHNTAPKRTALQLVQVFFNIQGAALLIPARFNVPACQGRFSSHFQMQEWHHLLLVVEMFLVSLLARIHYRKPLQLDAEMQEMGRVHPHAKQSYNVNPAFVYEHQADGPTQQVTSQTDASRPRVDCKTTQVDAITLPVNGQTSETDAQSSQIQHPETSPNNRNNSGSMGDSSDCLNFTDITYAGGGSLHNDERTNEYSIT